MCTVSVPLGVTEEDPLEQTTLGPIRDTRGFYVADMVSIGSLTTTITASVAVQLEGFSLMVVAYTVPESSLSSTGIVSFNYLLITR